MKKFFSLVLALVMALSLTTVAWGATTITVGATGCDYTTLADALANAGNGDTIQLSAGTYSGENKLATVKSITIKGADNYGTIITGGIYLGTDMSAANAGTTVTIEGIAFETTGIFVGDYATVTIQNNKFTNITANAAPSASSTANAISVVGNGVTANIAGNVIDTVAVAGINLRNTATASITGNTVSNTGHNAITIQNDATAVTITGNTLSNWGTSGEGRAMRISLSTSAATRGVVVEGNAMTHTAAPEQFVKVTEVTATDTASLNNNYWGGMTPADAGVIADNATVATYYADKAMTQLSVVGDTTAAAVKFYQADNSTTGWALLHTFAGADLDDFAMGADENCLPCYLVAGDYYAESTIAAATYKLTYGNKTVYLAPVDSTDVCYSAKASVLKVVDAEDATCGNWYVADLDETATYYATTDKKTGAVTAVYVAAKNGPVQLLVNGKIVDVKVDTAVKQLTHSWDGYDVVNGVYTSVKCANCEKVAKLYANATAAGKKAELVPGFGWITEAAAGYTTAGSVSTDKVESAETFDAGIAMYVGMSVMAAAGSAVVLKKKD